MKLFVVFVLTIFPTICFGLKCYKCNGDNPACGGTGGSKQTCPPTPEHLCETVSAINGGKMYWAKGCIENENQKLECGPYTGPPGIGTTDVRECFCNEKDLCNDNDGRSGAGGSGGGGSGGAGNGGGGNGGGGSGGGESGGVGAKSPSLAAWFITCFLSVL